MFELLVMIKAFMSVQKLSCDDKITAFMDSTDMLATTLITAPFHVMGIDLNLMLIKCFMLFICKDVSQSQ